MGSRTDDCFADHLRHHLARDAPMTKPWEELRDAAAEKYRERFRKTEGWNGYEDVHFKDGADFGREQGILEEREAAASDVHSCSRKCQREPCKLRRELEAERARADELQDALEAEEEKNLPHSFRDGVEAALKFEIFKLEMQLEAERVRSRGLLEALKRAPCECRALDIDCYKCEALEAYSKGEKG